MARGLSSRRLRSLHLTQIFGPRLGWNGNGEQAIVEVRINIGEGPTACGQVEHAADGTIRQLRKEIGALFADSFARMAFRPGCQLRTESKN